MGITSPWTFSSLISDCLVNLTLGSYLAIEVCVLCGKFSKIIVNVQEEEYLPQRSVAERFPK